MNTKKIAVPIVAFAFGIVVGLAFGNVGQLSQRAPAGLEQTAGTASVMLDFGDGRVRTFHGVPVAAGENVFDFLKRLTAEQNIEFAYKEYSGLGTLVTKIGDKEGGKADKYWQYWVNNRSPEIGASQYVVQAGDVIEWKFIKYQGE
jgi:hypothetical protein